MKWDDLLPPIQRAVRDLLVRIEGGIGQKEDKNGFLVNYFLVTGLRGTGKTTVLLSARDAVCKCGEFFKETDYGKARREKLEQNKKKKQQEDKQKNRTEASAKKLENCVVWIPVLDLEPLPAKTNLLATTLTWVSNALDTSHHECNDTAEGTAHLTSPFEEDAGSARQLLGRLINDATLMWEDISEPDTRNKANRQINAADIYADFRRRFEKAMEKLGKELGQRRGCRADGLSIVLSIDNIDRSTEHLYSMVKLAQMVSCRHLRLVMAGDREDFDTFLERAYWKELIRIGQEGAATMLKASEFGEDEAFVMARRQAATTSHRLLPPGHRIEIGFLTPWETLAFYPPRYLGGGEKTETIEYLLTNIFIPINRRQRKLLTQTEWNGEIETTRNDQRWKDRWHEFDEQKTGRGIISLLDLFCLPSEKNQTVVPPEVAPDMLPAGVRYGLSLPARTVLDLWLLANWVLNGPPSGDKDFKAEEIARTMLRSAITESTISSRVGRLLLDRIIRLSTDGGTELYFDEMKLYYSMLMTDIFKSRPVIENGPVEENSPYPSWSVWSQLYVKDFAGLRVKLRSRKNKYDDNPNDKGSDQKGDELPALVGAWLSILYDIVILAETSVGSMIVNYDPSVDFPVVEVTHWIAIQSSDFEQVSIKWPMPGWNTFWGRQIHFFKEWPRVKEWLKEATKLYANQGWSAVIRLLAAAWIASVLRTFVRLEWWLGDPDCELEQLDEQLKTIFSNKRESLPSVDEIERAILKAASRCYSLIKEKESRAEFTSETNYIDIKRTKVAEWLEEKLPLMLISPLYVSLDSDALSRRLENIKCSISNKDKLRMYWKDNRLFIRTGLEKELEEKVLAKMPSDDNEKRKQVLEWARGDLDRLWAD